MWQTRREFLKTTAAGGATVLVSRLVPFGLGEAGTASAAVMEPPRSWSGPAGQARYRIDGWAKVTGQKIYARDFRPRDLPGWPADYRHALVVRATFVDRLFEGLDLGVLPSGNRPQVVITGDDLARDGVGVATEEYPAGKYIVRKGERPDYFGQALAILLFDERTALERAREILVYDGRGVRTGKKVEVPPPDVFEPETSILHVMTSDGRQKFAQTMGGPVHPEQPGKRNADAMGYVHTIGKLFETEGWDVFEETYTTPVMDPMFMEPESGLAWFDRKKKTVELLIGTQSPAYDVGDVKDILEPSTLGVEKTHIYAAYPGGGFGGRDTSILCLYLGIAAAYSDKPVRILHDRFQQFQGGIKRHASRIELKVGVDAHDKLQAIRNHTFLNGGGRINVSSYVGDVAGIMGAGVYGFAWADIWVRPMHTRSLTAGSMRGFGAFQTTFAVESLIDEIAEKRGVDPIDLRLKNVLDSHQPIVTGAPIAPPGMKEMLEIARGHALWKGREAERERHRRGERAYGVGFALGMKNYGTGADATMAAASVAPDGKLTLTTSAIDAGQGLATALAVSTAPTLGRNADQIDTGEVAPFDVLQMVGSFDMQPDNPRWTPLVHFSTKSSAGSSRWVHAVAEASRILLETGVLPAARTLWGKDAEGIGVGDVRWVDGDLAAEGRVPIPFAELAREMHGKGFVVSTMCHAFFSARWISAEYSVDGLVRRWDVDGLAVQRGGRAGWDLLDRRKPHLFTVESRWEENGQTMGAAAALVAVEVHRKTGEPRVVAGVHLAAPGKMVVRPLVEGQMEGSWAMGIGHALLEELPAFADGATDGKWNLNRYHVALAGDCAHRDTEKVILPPESPHAPARGMGEVSLNPVAPAVANAVAHATGKRFRDLPITPAKLRAAWS